MQPKVSIIVPVYNVEKYIKRCIDSLIQQTLKDIEIILVNDGSPDNCPKICDEYEETFTQIKVIHKLNGGLSDARNKGLEAATGKYVLFIDSDDWVESRILESLYCKAEQDQTDIVVCSYSIDYTNNNFSVEKKISGLHSHIKNVSSAINVLEEKGMFNVVWNKLYRRKILDDNNIQFEIDGVPGEDLLFNCEVFKKVKSVSLTSEVLYHYMREDEDTLVNKYNANLYKQVKKFNLARKNLYQYYEMDSDKNISCYANKYVEYISSCIPNLYRKNFKVPFKEKMNFYNLVISDSELNNYLDKVRNLGEFEKLFLVLIKTKSPIIMCTTYNFLFLMRNYFDGLYRLIRKKILN